MDLTQFFKTYQPRYRAVYKTTTPLLVDSYVWELCQNPNKDHKQFQIPAGTELVVNSYSNFGDGYSMQPRNPRKVLTGKNLTKRWFKVLFTNMEFIREEKVD